MNGVTLLQDFLSDTAARLPDKHALVCGESRLTYRELEERSNGLAHALMDGGLVRGDRVLVHAENSVEAVIAFWAALKANAVPSLIHPQTKSDKLAYYLNDSEAQAIVSQAQLATELVPAIERAPKLGQLVISGETPLFSQVRTLGFEEASRPRSDAPRRAAIDIDLAAIVYTSGSTGDPKGVMLTHRNMLTAASSITTYLRMREDDVVLDVLPLSFDYGLYQMIMTFKVGGRLVLEKSFAYPGQVLSRMTQEKVTGFPGVPTIFATLFGMHQIWEQDFSSLRFVTNTAAALPGKHIEQLRKLFPNARVFSMYGLTECKRCTYLPPEDLDRKPGSVGVPIPNTEAWVIDDQGRRLGPNQIGQLVIRGATVMRGYWRKPEASAEKLRPGPLPGESVLHTGDLCRMDEEGYVYFVGRMDDIIKSRGEKVAPKEVETVLMNVHGVREVAVIGVPDPLLGQAVKAFVVLEPGAQLSARELQRECQKRLEPFSVPKLIELVPELPKTSTGKIKKTNLA
jgi:amino acid adenylation domain-containing protein